MIDETRSMISTTVFLLCLFLLTVDNVMDCFGEEGVYL